MRERLPRLVSVMIVALIGVEFVGTIVLIENWGAEQIAGLGFMIGAWSVGTVLVMKLPRHPIGWLLLVSSLFFVTGALTVSYVEAALAGSPQPIPVAPWMVWLGSGSFGLGIGITVTLLLLFFPTGRLPSRRWRVVVWGSVLGLLLLLVGVGLSPENFEELPFENPIGLDESSLVLLALEGGGFYVFLVAVMASIFSLLYRYRRSRGVERQQLKWVALGVALAGAGIVGPAVLELANGAAEIPSAVENAAVTLGMTGVPIVIGLSVVRYRLYEIDRIISRTVSYAVVVGLLAVVFSAGVVGLPGLFDLGDSPLSVAASTLAVAALFNPLRKRVQVWVDRRFNRSRFDVERVMGQFAGSLRDEVDPDVVVQGWLGVVSETMQPSSTAIWVKE